LLCIEEKPVPVPAAYLAKQQLSLPKYPTGVRGCETPGAGPTKPTSNTPARFGPRQNGPRLPAPGRRVSAPAQAAAPRFPTRRSQRHTPCPRACVSGQATG
jgi:hypothetical protein